MPARLPLLLAVALLGVAPASLRAGTIAGVLRARGPAGAEGGAAGGAYGSLRYKFAERVDYAHLRDFVVYIDQPLPATGPLPLATVTQRNVAFEPRILPIVVGTRVRWPNADTIFHNVFSLSDAKPFDLGLYARDDAKVPEIVFDRPGRVDVFCGIHSKMHGIVLVLPSPYFAQADSNQRYFIRDVPAGTYRLRAWHERLRAQSREITVPAVGEVRADFTLGLGELPRY